MFRNATRYMRALVRGKYFRSSEGQILEASWQDISPNFLKVPRPSLKAILFIIVVQFKDKNPVPKPESFVDTTIVTSSNATVSLTQSTSDSRASRE